MWAVPAIALITGLAATITWWVVLQNDVLDSERRQFAEVAARIVARIDERMVMTEQMIVGIAAIVGMDAGGSQFRDWGEYITRLSLDSERDLPPTAGFIPRIERAALGRHEQQQRAAGNANYRVWPIGERPVYYPLARLEPPGQKAVLGYDGYSEPIRRAAMDRALATRKPAMTSMVILKSHTEEKDTPVFIVYAPILSGAYPASGRPDGRQITALVATMCRINDVLTSVLRLSHGEAEVAMYTLPADLKPPQQYFGRIDQSGQRLLVLLNDLLDLSKLEAGGMTYELATNNLQSVAQSVIVELEAYARERKVRVQLEPAHEPATALCDAVRIGQVVRNLLSNAIKFTPPFKSISIRVTAGELTDERLDGRQPTQPAVLITVSDQGIGIPESELALVFDKFTQSSKTKTGAGGTGLGLAICQEIVAQHHGRIWAANNASGGADFMVLLPREQSSLRAPELKQREQAA